MRNKRLYISMLILTIVFLIFMYVVKIWYPEQFVMTIENDKIVKIGEYIDNHKWLYYICCGIPAFITYWLYLCAVSHRLYLKWYECLYIIGAILLIRIISLYDLQLSTIIMYAMFLILPALTNGNIKSCSHVFTVHIVAQWLSLKIRNLPVYLTNINYITSLFMTIECYLWLILCYLISNLKKENKTMGQICPPLYGKSKFYAKKKARAEKKIAKLQEIIKVCDEELAKEDK